MSDTAVPAGPAPAAAFELLALLDAAVDAIVLIDHRGTVEVFNRAAERLFGYAAGAVVGRNVSMLMTDADREAHDAYLERYLDSGVPHVIGTGREVSARRADGSVFPALLSVGRIQNTDPPRFVGFIQDLTLRQEALRLAEQERARAAARHEETRRLQERLMHVARLTTLGEMASGVAHELNQPLAAITTFAQASLRILERDAADIGEVRDALRQIAAQALRAGEMIHRLRDLVRRHDSQRESVCVNDLVSELPRLMRTDLRSNDIRFSLELAEDLPALEVDRIQIQQVLVSLLRNAIDAVAHLPPERREIRALTGRHPDGCVEVQLCDAGEGVSSSVAETLFHPFASTRPNGAGLGLATSRSIVQAHGGAIGYRPRLPCGACFYFTLPVTAWTPAS